MNLAAHWNNKDAPLVMDRAFGNMALAEHFVARGQKFLMAVREAAIPDVAKVRNFGFRSQPNRFSCIICKRDRGEPSKWKEEYSWLLVWCFQPLGNVSRSW